MDLSALQSILKKFDLTAETQVNRLEFENKNEFQKIVRFLNSFAKFLNIYKRKQEFVMVKDLADMSSNKQRNETSRECIIFDFKKAFQEFRSGLPENIDTNFCILECFSTCLTYIINDIHNEPENVMEVYDNFLELLECIHIFSRTSIILETNGFKNILSFFITDLIKILTGSEFSMQKPNQLKVCNLIRKILAELAESKLYCEIILRHILKNIKCALSYHKTNENFDGYVASQIFVIEYFLWIIKTILNHCYFAGFSLYEKLNLEMRQVLEHLKNCLENKIPSVLMNYLDDILLNL